MALLLFAAGVAAQSPPEARCAIRVDFDSIIRAIPSLLFGQNLQPIEREEGILRRDGSVDPEIMTLLHEARITTLRYPGGETADFFHWWQALGPHSGRPKQSLGEYSPIVGPEEFIAIARALGAVPLVTVNSGTGTPQEAGDWASFFHAREFPVPFWEVGGGLSGLPPALYAQQVVEYAAAIRRAAPTAKIYATVGIDPESFRNVAALAGASIDGISLHDATFPGHGHLSDGTVPSDEYLFTAMLAATEEVDRSIAALEEQLYALGKLIPIFVTGYNAGFLADAPTLGCALFNAGVLHVLARHRLVHGAHHLALAGERCGGLVGTGAETTFRNPQFYVHREYANEAGKLLVETTVEAMDAVFHSGPLAQVPGHNDVPMLDAIATRDPAARSFALFVVNRSLTAAVNASVSLELPGGVEGTVSLLWGPSYAARNDAQNPDRVALTTVPFAAGASFSHRFPPHSLTIFRWSR